jgi:hypothetical protein
VSGTIFTISNLNALRQRPQMIAPITTRAVEGGLSEIRYRGKNRSLCVIGEV